MGDVGVELGAAVGVAHRAVLVELAAAGVAEPRPQVVLAPALVAPVGEFPARHRHEHALRPLDDLQVPDDEGVVEGDRAEREQPLAVRLAQLDADFRDDHRCSPSCGIRGRNCGPRGHATRVRRAAGRFTNAAARRLASSRDRHTANTADPLPDISAPHEPSREALANSFHRAATARTPAAPVG